jgi:hypothetical protein
MGWAVSFWTLLATLAAVYFGYPLALFLLSRRSRRREDGPQEDDLPSLTILVPAYDEEGVIAAKIRNILDLDYPRERLSALVISDASGDGTYETACGELESASEEDRARIRIVRNPTRTGKTVTLSTWVSEATGEILLFTDANALYRPDAARRLAAHFREPTVGLVCGRLRYVDDPERGASAENLYWRYEDAIKGWEGRLGRLLVANGSIYAVRREHFEEMPGSVADDFVVPLVTFQKGARLVYEPDAVAEERPPIRAAEDFRSKARIVTRGLEAVLRYRGRIVASGPLRVAHPLLPARGMGPARARPSPGADDRPDPVPLLPDQRGGAEGARRLPRTPGARGLGEVGEHAAELGPLRAADADAGEPEAPRNRGGLADRHRARLHGEAREERVRDPLRECLDQTVLPPPRDLLDRAVDLCVVDGLAEPIGLPGPLDRTLELEVDPNEPPHTALGARDPESRGDLDPVEQDRVDHPPRVPHPRSPLTPRAAPLMLAGLMSYATRPRARIRRRSRRRA